MHAAVFVALAAGLVALALRRARSRALGALHGLAGVIVLFVAAYAWIIVLWRAWEPLARVLVTLPAVARAVAAFVVLWGPPALVAAGVVALLGGRGRAAR